MIIQWIFIAAITYAAGIWGVINCFKRYRQGLNYKLDVNDPNEKQNGNSAPPVAIICPGRNEAEHIKETLYELCEQDFPNYKVIYVDDDSQDDTQKITSAAKDKYDHLTIVHNKNAPPPDWIGKCWALDLGYKKLRKLEFKSNQDFPPAKWICFTDADIHWDKNTLTTAIDYANNHSADVVSLFPLLQFGSAIEAIVQMQMVLAMGILFPLEKAMDPNHPDTITGGSFILVRRSLYDKIGGHENENIKGEIVDDISLGRALKSAGGKIAIALTPDLLQCRMYENWGDMWEGLTKNAFAGMDYSLWKVTGASLGVLFGAVLSPIYLIISCIWVIIAQTPLSFVALVLSIFSILLPALSLYRICKMLKVRSWFAFTMPMGTAIYLVFILVSAFKYYFGGNVWKGRAYGKDG